MDQLIKDIRYGIRSLIRQPAFTIVVVITVGLGIGANTIIFSIINALILNPPSMVEPDRVVAIWKTPIDNHVEGFVSYLDLQDWRARNQSFVDIAGYKPQTAIVMDRGEAERLGGIRVTANFFSVLKTNLFRGRNFQLEEEARGAAPVAIISYEFWQSRLAGDENVLNQPISIDDKAHTIIGILPPRFDFPLSFSNVPIWTTVAAESENLAERGAFVLKGFGRLKAGVTIEQAQAEMVAIGSSLAEEYPSSNRDTTIFLVSAHDQIVGGNVRRALWLLLGAVGFILLIACSNSANLLMVRATAKEKEIAVRAALGAGRWRIARQLLIESLLLSFVAGFAGLMIAVWGLKAITYFGANQLPRLNEVQIDARVMTFTLGVSILTGLLFSLLPSFKVSRPDINEVLRSGTRTATSGKTLRFWRDAFVVTEVALSLVLLVGAGLMIRSFSQLTNVSPGFDPTNVLTGGIVLVQSRYENQAARLMYVNQTLERLRALPGVESAALVAPMPFSGADVGGDFRIEGRAEPEPGREPSARTRTITPEYFQLLRIPLIKGRYFNDQDKRGGVGAAIINQTFAKRHSPNEEPVGRYISNIGVNQNQGDPERWEIVGVTADTRHNSLTKGATPELYLAYSQNSWPWGNFLIRTTSDPATLMTSFRDQIKMGDKAVPLTRVRTMDQAISETVSQPRFYTVLFGLFGAIGLVLTITGIYGVVSYAVSQRTQEIGIRMALGATQQNVIRMVLLQGITLSILGAIIGILMSIGVTRVIAGLLFDVKPIDLLTFSVATFVLLASGVLASYLPARRATKVDPLVALRYE